jgi:GDP-L-fucose synthase
MRRDTCIHARTELHCSRVGVKLVSCLSTCIFPHLTSYPIDESMIHDGPPHASNEGYSYAKRMLEVHSRLCRAAHGVDFVSVVPTNVYGQHDNFSLQHSHVIPGLIHRAVLAKQSGTPFCVAGTGTPLRQFIYSKDLARLLLWALRNYSSPEPLILSCDEADEVSIGDAAAIIADAVGVQGPILFDATKPDGQHKKTASNARLKALYPGKLAFTPLRDGIQATVAWFTTNWPAVRM